MFLGLSCVFPVDRLCTRRRQRHFHIFFRASRRAPVPPQARQDVGSDTIDAGPGRYDRRWHQRRRRQRRWQWRWWVKCARPGSRSFLHVICARPGSRSFLRVADPRPQPAGGNPGALSYPFPRWQCRGNHPGARFLFDPLSRVPFPRESSARTCRRGRIAAT